METLERTAGALNALPIGIRVATAEGGPWFFAEDVCKALGTGLNQVRTMPPEWASKVVDDEGNKVLAVNAAGLLAIAGMAGLRSGSVLKYAVTIEHAQGTQPEQRREGALIRGAQAVLGALMHAYPRPTK